MKSFKTTIYFHRDKDENWDLEAMFMEHFNAECRDILYTGYEIAMEIEVFENGRVKLLSVEGIDVSKENVEIN